MHATRYCAIPSAHAQYPEKAPTCSLMEELKVDEALKRDCERAYYAADEGDKGYLTPEDYKVAVVSLLGYKPSKYEIGSMWKHCTGDGMTRATFVELMVERLKQQDSNELIRQVFLTFDTHCQGFITLENCRGAFRKVAPHIADTEVEAFFAEIDSNCDGKISYRDFEIMMKHFQLLSVAKN